MKISDFYNSVVFLFSTLFCCLLLSACESKLVNGNQPETKLHTSSGASENESISKEMQDKQTGKMSSPAKPGASVRLKTNEPFFITEPGVFDYSLVLLSDQHEGEMSVDISTSDEIAILPSDTNTKLENTYRFRLAPDGEYEIPLKLNVTKEGRFYIHLHVTIQADNQATTRVLAAILQVGKPDANAQKPSTKSLKSDVDDVILLPAQETISPR